MLIDIDKKLFKSKRQKTRGKRTKLEIGGETNSEHMDLYYYYWERQVYNAIVKMILRGLLTYYNLYKICDNKNYKNDNQNRKISLFQIKATYNNP